MSSRACRSRTAASAAYSRAVRALPAPRPVTCRSAQKRGRWTVVWNATRARAASQTRSVMKQGRSAEGSVDASTAVVLSTRAMAPRAASGSQPHLASARHDVSAEQYLEHPASRVHVNLEMYAASAVGCAGTRQAAHGVVRICALQQLSTTAPAWRVISRDARAIAHTHRCSSDSACTGVTLAPVASIRNLWPGWYARLPGASEPLHERERLRLQVLQQVRVVRRVGAERVAHEHEVAHLLDVGVHNAHAVLRRTISCSCIRLLAHVSHMRALEGETQITV